jgi:hypothetical protein
MEQLTDSERESDYNAFVASVGMLLDDEENILDVNSPYSGDESISIADHLLNKGYLLR